MYPVYLITNTVNGKKYVGCILKDEKTIETRFKEHCRQSRAPYLHSAIKKHGKESFSIHQIAAGVSPEQALTFEALLIAELNTKTPNGYNLTDGGKGSVGFSMPDSAKQKLRMSQLGRTHVRTVEYRKTLSAALTGRTFSDEHRLNLSKVRKGISHWTDERRKKHSERMSGVNNPNYKDGTWLAL